MECPHCKKSINYSDVYCPYCKKKVEIKKRKKIYIVILYLILLLSYILLNIEIKVGVPEVQLFLEPVEINRLVNITYEKRTPTCINQSYKFTTKSGLVENFDSFIRPDLTVYNLEDKWGYYLINFSFIDEAKFPEKVYGGAELKSKLDSGEISVLDADIYSELYVYYLGPGESVRIQEKTPKIYDKTYWAIATITEPTFLNCFEKFEIIQTEENKTFTQNKEVKKTVYVKKYRSLREIIHIKDFWQWFILITLLVIILYLIIRVLDERDIVLMFKK